MIPPPGNAQFLLDTPEQYPDQPELRIRTGKNTERKVPARGDDAFVLPCLKDQLVDAADSQLAGDLCTCSQEILCKCCNVLEVLFANRLYRESFKERGHGNHTGLVADLQELCLIRQPETASGPFIPWTLHDLPVGSSRKFHTMDGFFSESCDNAFLVLLQFVPDPSDIGRGVSDYGDEFIG